MPNIKLKDLPPKVIAYHPLKSFKYAFFGLYIAFMRENNIRIQLALGITLTIVGIFTKHYISSMANFILMGMVISLEMINTAMETMCDLLTKEMSLKVKIIKDISAGAVLMLALVWLVTIIYLLLVISGVKYFQEV